MDLETTSERTLARIPVVRAYDTLPFTGKVMNGVILDCETTGLDPTRDTIIELCLTPFYYDREGRIGSVIVPYTGLEDPGAPLSDEVRRVTGLKDEDLAGQRLDDAIVIRVLDYADLIIAHNAAFDRRFVEHRFPIAASRDWACSLQQVPWQQIGFGCTKLACLASQAGWTFPPHRAEEDCRALLHLLHSVRHEGQSAFKLLIDAAAKPTIRLVAIGAPYEVKDLLKARGYRWNDGTDGRPKAWWIEVDGDAVDAERDWLLTLTRQATIKQVTARDRYSVRA